MLVDISWLIESIHVKTVSNVRENLQYLDVSIFNHILSSRKINSNRMMRENKNLFDVEECKTFIFKTDFRNVPELMEVHKEYGVELPNVEYNIICRKEDGRYLLEFYSGFENYGIRYFQFSISEDTLREDTLRDYLMDMLEGNLDNMCWEEALKIYLEEDKPSDTYSAAFEK